MHSIQGRLLRAFLLIIATMSLVTLGFLAMHVYVVDKYRAISERMVAEYELVATSSRLISAYNNRALSNESGAGEANEQVEATKRDIAQLTSYLDTAIVDKQSRSSYVGLKNSTDVLVSTIDESLQSFEAGGINNYNDDYKAANKRYDYVHDNGSTLIFDELKYTASIRDQIDATYRVSQVAGFSTLVLILIACAMYVVRESRRVTSPLAKLTTIAQRIAGGDMNVAMDKDLLTRPDETGSLSNSFNLMIGKLKEKMHELHAEKVSVEHKVEMRTAELSREKARLDASISSLSLGFIMTDNQNNIVAINRAAAHTLSHPADDDTKPAVVSDANHQWTIDEIDLLFKDSLAFKRNLEQGLRENRPIECKDVEYGGRILRIFFTPITDKDAPEGKQAVLGSVVVLQDITEERILLRSKDEFFSIASHELRTPLTAIRGNANMILDYYEHMFNDPAAKEMVMDIYNSSLRLIDIVNDFLDVSRIEQGKLLITNEAVAMDKIIESVIYEMRVVLREKKLYLKTDSMTLANLPEVWVDKNRVKQIIYNLVGNAAKFTEKGGITISAAVDGKFIRVSITDTGPGIPVEQQQLLFHKFQQAGKSLLTRDATRGTGLGLYISRLLSEKMGGAVSLDHSEPGKGTTFSFTALIATDELKRSSHTEGDKL